VRATERTSRRVAWVLLGLVLVLALAIGTHRPAGPPTEDQRVRRISSVIRCPTCHSLSAAQSDAPASESIRDEVRLRIQDGQTDGQIKAYLVSRYGDDILLQPKTSGVAVLVWALPVVGLVLAVAGVALVLRRGRVRPGRRVSDADRALVEEALRR
jgi:cytochrome c-type biogenesis protein CcmH